MIKLYYYTLKWLIFGIPPPPPAPPRTLGDVFDEQDLRREY